MKGLRGLTGEEVLLSSPKRTDRTGGVSSASRPRLFPAAELDDVATAADEAAAAAEAEAKEEAGTEQAEEEAEGEKEAEAAARPANDPFTR